MYTDTLIVICISCVALLTYALFEVQARLQKLNKVVQTRTQQLMGMDMYLFMSGHCIPPDKEYLEAVESLFGPPGGKIVDLDLVKATEFLQKIRNRRNAFWAHVQDDQDVDEGVQVNVHSKPH